MYDGATKPTATDMGPLVADCHLALGKLHRRAGDPAQARKHLTAAAAMYREMDLRFWQEPADEELRAPSNLVDDGASVSYLFAA